MSLKLRYLANISDFARMFLFSGVLGYWADLGLRRRLSYFEERSYVLSLFLLPFLLDVGAQWVTCWERERGRYSLCQGRAGFFFSTSF